MKYFLIAGEASGDLHASRLMHGLQKLDSKAEFLFVGGDLMAEEAGKDPLYHYRIMNFMGVFSVLWHLARMMGILKQVKRNILAFRPDVVILVDYAGFNLRIARFVTGHGFRVFYYISPKVWAWKKGRIKLLREYVTRLFVIFPFEVPYFREQGIDVIYEGNPLTDVLHDYQDHAVERKAFLQGAGLDDRPLIALLAGSRKQEIRLCLPVMCRVAAQFPGYRFVVAGAPSMAPEYYDQFLTEDRVRIVFGQTYDLLQHAHAAIVTSGTATLETALFGVPQAVVYKTGWVTYGIGKLFVKFRFFGLVNLIFGDELVREFLQKDLETRLREELQRLIHDEDYRKHIQEGYATIRSMIGPWGVADRIGKRMTELLRN